MCVLATIAQVASPAGNPSSEFFGLPGDLIINLVKIGEFGSAVAMLVLGFYLHWQASKAQLADIPARKGVAKQFMFFAVLFFIVCCVVELVKLAMPERHPGVTAVISVPPINDTNYEEYGKIDIVPLDPPDQKSQSPKHAGLPKYFTVHDSSQITIDVSGLTEKLKDTKRALDDNLTKGQVVGSDPPK
jgi:hypothetical protein